MRKRIRVACAAALGAGAVVLGTSSAHAQDAGPPTCASLIAADTTAFSATPAVVYIAGSSASQIPLQALAPVVAAQNIAIVYQGPDSCVGVGDLIGHTAEATAAYSFLDPQNVNSQGLAAATTCTVAGAPPIDIAPSDVFPDTCATKLSIGTAGAITTTSTPIRDFWGPVQAMTFAVPSGSTAQSISAEAAYVAFGYDAVTYSVTPWTVAGSIYTRPHTSGTMNMLGAAIKLDPNKFVNANPTSMPYPSQYQAGTGGMRNALANANGTANVNATLGQLSYSAVESAANAAMLKILAFQGYGQSCGYLPGSDSTHLDMINVRQGRYEIWGPLHFIVNVDSNGVPLGGNMTANPAVVTLMNYFLATGPNPPASVSMDAGAFDGGVSEASIQKLIQVEAKPGYVVPWCAMQATRSTEVGAPASYSPSAPCGCFYESVLGVHTSTYCKSCGTDADCADAGTYSHCRYGFCEAQ
jgi:hypothetical protein